MAERPTLRLRDTQNDRFLTATPDEHGILIDDEGRPLGVAFPGEGDFGRYRLVGVDLPVGLGLVRQEDDGAQTEFALDEYEESPASDDGLRGPWRATFVAPNVPTLVLSEDELIEGLQEHPPVYRFA